MLLVSFHTPWKYQKTKSFLIFFDVSRWYKKKPVAYGGLGKIISNAFSNDLRIDKSQNFLTRQKI